MTYFEHEPENCPKKAMGFPCMVHEGLNLTAKDKARHAIEWEHCGSTICLECGGKVNVFNRSKESIITDSQNQC